MGTPYHRFSTLWKIQEFIVFLVQVQGARGAQQRTNDPLFTRPQNKSNWKTMQLHPWCLTYTLKNDGWKTTFLWNGEFPGAMLNFGGVTLDMIINQP